MKNKYGTRVATAAASAALFSGALFLAPVASAADISNFPVPGSQPADVVYNQLKAMGYSVAINWTSANSGTQLSLCKVSGYHAPGAANTKVYMDVVCSPDGSNQ